MEENGNLSPPKTSLRDLVEQDVKSSSENRKKIEPITYPEYMDKLEEDPDLGQLAHQRMHSIVKSCGYEEISHTTDPRRAKILRLEPGFVMRVPKLFKDFRGIEDVLFDIDNYLYMAACQGEASRQMLYFWGPPSSGKTTLAETMRKELENYGFWQLEGCENHDNPINATPRHIRKEIYEKLGIYIDPRADICPKCRKRLINEFDYDYTKFKVEWKSFSQRKGCGIAVVSEVDPINFNMAVLIGEEDISLLGEYRRGDPETLVLNGAINKGQRGSTEFVEIWKNPIEAQRPIITITQEKYAPLPKFSGQIYADTMLVSHSNETEWRKFKSDPTNEAIMNRIYIRRVPYNLRLSEEVQIYRDSFLGKSTGFRNVHIDPHALEQIAMFVLFTRLAPTDSRFSILDKIKMRDGQTVLTGGEPISLTLKELMANADPREGMVGLSYRDAAKEVAEKSIAYYRCFWEKDKNLVEKGGYINAVWIRNLMVKYVKDLDIPQDADWPKPSKKRWLAFIQDDLHKEFVRLVENDLIEAYLAVLNVPLKNKVDSLFKAYINHAVAFVNNIDGAFDKKFLQSVEDHLSMLPNEREAFRRETAKAAFILRADSQKIDSNMSAPLKQAVEEMVKRRLVREVLEALQNESKKQAIISKLAKIGYANMGGQVIANYALTNLNRD